MSRPIERSTKLDLSFLVGLLASVFLSHSLGRFESELFFILFGLGWVVPLFYLLEKNGTLLFVSLVVLAGSFLLKFFVWRVPFLSLFALTGAALLGVGWMGLKKFDRGFLEMDQRRKESGLETASLRNQLVQKKETLEALRRNVEEIAHLFELAKGFNECLSYEGIVALLRDRIFTSIPFKRLALYVLSDFGGSTSWVKKFSILQNGSEPPGEAQRPMTALELTWVDRISKEKKVIRIQSSDEKEGSFPREAEMEAPLWFFPLLVEDRLIALWLVEKAREEDYPKFAVIAAQLALQVEKVRLYETVKELSIVDGLTRVFVRRHFTERFEEELKRSIRHRYEIGLLLLDIDHFKTYNDRYGHLVGDVTLREVARVIRETVRSVDMVGRYGGEEFVVLLPETDKAGALEVSERIRSSVAKSRFKVYDEETQVTVSVGATSFPVDLEARGVAEFREGIIDELLKKADEALYRAKEEGRNRVVAY